jgi:hypothetical protein
MTKGYLINAETLEISDIEVSDFTDIQKHIGCDYFDCVGLNSKGDTLYVDDEGLMKVNRLTIVITEGGARRLAGNIVVLGSNAAGDSVKPSITKEQLRKLVPLSSIKKN